MKVADIFKHHAENLVKHNEFKQLMPPTVREYWGSYWIKPIAASFFHG